MRLTINFLMKKSRQKNNGEIPVYVRFTMNSKRVELSTGIYCHSDRWDDVGQQIRGRTESVRILNNRLDKIQNEIQDHYNKLKSSGEEFNVTTIKWTCNKKVDIELSYAANFCLFINSANSTGDK